MEIYKEKLDSTSKEFEKLLNSQFTKNKNLKEGTIIKCTVTKVTSNFVYLAADGLKQEPILDINELKSMGIIEKAKIGESIDVLLERIEHPKTGEIVVSASKAAKIAGWDRLVESYEKNEPIIGKIISRCKGGVICEHIDTRSLLFMPGSQINDKPLKDKDITNLMNEPMKLAIIKLDKIRGLVRPNL